MDARKRLLTNSARHLCYCLSLLLAYVLETTPAFLSIAGIKPVLLVPAALCIAVYEGAFGGALYGAVAGLMLDLASGRTGGFFAIMLMVFCFLVSALVTLYLRNTILNLSVLSGIVLLFMLSSDFLFGYLLHGYAGLGRFYLTRVLPTVVFSAAMTFSFWYLERLIRVRLTPPD